MLPFILILAGLSALAAGTAYYFVNPVNDASQLPDAPQASPDRMRADVQALVSTPKPRNFQHMPSLEQAAEYIHSEFERSKLSVRDQSYEARGLSFRNVIGVYGDPRAKRKLVVGAHYDVCGSQDGADDNGSAVAGMLEIARLLTERKSALPFAVEFVGFANEEPPFFGTEQMGSHVHVEEFRQSGCELVTMLCLEMIGYYSDKSRSQRYPYKGFESVYPTVGNFVALVGNTDNRRTVARVKKAMLSTGGIPVYSINAPASIPGLDFSDHRNYWKYHYDAIMVTDTSYYRNPHYHQASDTIDTLDFKRMAAVVSGLVAAIESLK